MKGNEYGVIREFLSDLIENVYVFDEKDDRTYVIPVIPLIPDRNDNIETIVVNVGDETANNDQFLSLSVVKMILSLQHLM